MNTFDPNTSGAGNPGTLPTEIDRSRRSERSIGGDLSFDQLDGLAVVKEYPFVGFEFVRVAVSVAQHDALLLPEGDDDSPNARGAVRQLRSRNDFQHWILAGGGVIADHIGRRPAVSLWHG